MGNQFDLYCLHHPVLSNRVFSCVVQIGRLCRDFRRRFRPLRTYVVSGRDFSARVCASQNLVPGGQGFRRRTRLLLNGSQTRDAFGTASLLGRALFRISPSTSNCLHSVGRSRRRSMTMPRGRRHSTAALTRLGARKAGEMVMLTCRTLHFSRSAWKAVSPPPGSTIFTTMFWDASSYDRDSVKPSSANLVEMYIEMEADQPSRRRN
jgi:hypothetical protein